MTRPMPGPPEYWWYCTPPHGEPGLCTSDMDPAEYMPFTHLQHKHLTDTECAAHSWQAKWRWMGSVYSGTPILPSGLVVDADPIEVTRELDRHKHTWHRFATRPHALEES